MGARLATPTVIQAIKPGIKALATKVVNYGEDKRFVDLHTKESYYRGTPYDSRPYDWRSQPSQSGAFGGTTVNFSNVASGMFVQPTELRKPNTPYHLGRIVVNRFTALLCGERRFPRIRVPKSETTEAYINELARTVQLKARTTEAKTIGGAVGSVIMAFNVVDGRFRVETYNTKWCNIEWKDFHDASMEAFAIVYPFVKQVYNEEKKIWETKPFLFRRLITDQVDITYIPQEARIVVNSNSLTVKPVDEKATPQVDETKAYHHGLGFLPAVFIQNLPRYDQIDGDTDCETAYDLFDRINENLSAIHSAQQGNLDPTLVLKITPEDYKKLESMGGVIQTGANGAAVVVGATGDAKYIEITCEGIKVALDIVKELRTYALELCDCVIADPHRITGAAQSAAAISKLYAPMLSKADMLRTQYGENGIKKLLGLMLQAYYRLTQKRVGEDGPEQGVFKPLWRVNPKNQKVEVITPDKDIDAEDLMLQWGDYFEPTAADIFQAVEAGVMAAGGKPIASVGVTTKFIAPFLNDYDPDATIAALEKQEAEERSHELQLGMAAGAGKNPNLKFKKPSTPANEDD